MEHYLAPELRWLVSQSVAILGDHIREELGVSSFGRIEKIRIRMTRLRGASTQRMLKELRHTYLSLRKLDSKERLDIARAYTMMLEIMNACENAYRSVRIRERSNFISTELPDSIIYVLTAHPTEARSPQNIEAFQEIQRVMIEVLAKRDQTLSPGERARLLHWIKIAWKAPAIRKRKPRVHDEAEHIYSTLLRDETLKALLKAGRELTPVYIRSWVGGDKDGHPGVDERTFIDSLQLSRSLILRFMLRCVAEVAQAAEIINSKEIIRQCRNVVRLTHRSKHITQSDGLTILRLRTAVFELLQVYEAQVSISHPALIELRQLLKVFPALVVPIEFRESSDVLRSSLVVSDLAISRMLQSLAKISEGTDASWYVRGFILSMTSSFADIQLARDHVCRFLGALRIPVIPLFEQSAALEAAPQIARSILDDPQLKSAIKEHWGNRFEVMLGYSDSAKEIGVLPSRLKIAKAMHKLNRLCQEKGVVPIFFQGSGGSVDRGGGTVSEQTAWWPAGALRNYKVTLQGEMVERSLASPEITRGQLERIAESAGIHKSRAKKTFKPSDSKAVLDFAARAADAYQKKILSKEFLKTVELATPYRYLSAMKIGSRPSKRTKGLSVSSLRAIPWVLCWTQARVLFPTWWGIGSAWKASSQSDRKLLREAYGSDPVYSTYVRALGFTLFRIRLPVWRIYLEHSPLSPSEVERTWSEFEREYDEALSFAHTMMGEELLSWRPWLAESINLRSPMIHPLNLLQVIALETKDLELLRLSLLGVASGMMTTG